MTDTYNGWTNWATWNVNLWIDNEEWLYHAKISLLESAWRTIEGIDVRAFVTEHMHGTTPDFDSPSDIAAVDWQEIAEHWETERQEMITEDA